MAERLVYQRKDGLWAWNLKADNGEIIATDGGQGFENVDDARAIVDKILAGGFANAAKKWIDPDKKKS
jgi:uncharacterized protein YegP (UPF0339 family)